MEPASYTPLVEDYVAYNRRIAFRRVGLPSALIIVAINLVAFASGGLDDVSDAFWSVGFVAAFLAYYLLVFVPQYARGIFADQPSLSEVRTLTIDDQGIEIRCLSGWYRTEWRHLYQWDETSRLLVLYLNRAFLLPIPKTDIGETMIAQIRDSLVKSGLSAPLHRRVAR